jgi:hypothetical protein
MKHTELTKSRVWDVLPINDSQQMRYLIKVLLKLRNQSRCSYEYCFGLSNTLVHGRRRCSYQKSGKQPKAEYFLLTVTIPILKPAESDHDGSHVVG